MALRCNGKLDCSDGTDELECDMVIRNIGYNKLLVPSGEHETFIINVSVIVREVTFLIVKRGNGTGDSPFHTCVCVP